MKRFLSIILSLFYFSLTTSATVNVHYCGGKLESIQINNNVKSCCCDSKEMPDRCCENKIFVLEIDTDENIINIPNSIPEKVVIYAILYDYLELNIQTDSKDFLTQEYFFPPPKSDPIWLLNCSLTYYG